MKFRLYNDDYCSNYQLVEIQEAEYNDAQGILSLQKRAFFSEALLNKDFSIEPLTQSIEDLRNEMMIKFTIKASIKKSNNQVQDKYQQDKIIGSVRANILNNQCHISRLCVDPEFQGLGLGTVLMDIVESQFCQAEKYLIFTGQKSRRNIDMYKKRKYQIIKSVPVNDNLTIVHMEKMCRFI